ncbi:MAG: acyl-CoA dehydrogenase family protein [Bacteroidales bacterium]|nr:acyl-CoA dehydrogenase family protein [Bacteroidales bacterium]
MITTDLMNGGEFLVKDVRPEDIFIPEEFNEEQLMIAQTCNDFVETEVAPHFEALDKHEEGLMPTLLKKAGEMGLLGIAVPEELEGFGQSFLTNMKANEAIGSAYSFSVAFMAHTGIGTLPLLYYGNQEQKQKYIPRLATGEWLAAYCLTEPGAGSDANAGKTKAVLSEDGKHYVLNGQKMWITNGGFADLLTVFAKIDNDRVLSAFLVESSWEGISMNPEEEKMGIKGSSTRQIFFNDVKVPVENLLGNRGQGFRIALNILHVGRIKLGATVIGAMHRAVNNAVGYSMERKQFGSPLSDFGAIQHKLAEQVVKLFSTESSVYRASKDIENVIDAKTEAGSPHGEAHIEGIAEFEPECALLKVYGSESLDYIVDEMVQIYGGMGFSSEAPADRSYRDSRINRIFEGTNEINRLIVADSELKRGLKHKINLFEKAEEVKQMLNGNPSDLNHLGYYELKHAYVSNIKKTLLLLMTSAHEHFGKKLTWEEEIQMNFANMLMSVYVLESTLLRIEKLEQKGLRSDISVYRDILDVLTQNVMNEVQKESKEALSAFLEGEEKKEMLRKLELFTTYEPVNAKESRRRIAGKLIDDQAYKF